MCQPVQRQITSSTTRGLTQNSEPSQAKEDGVPVTVHVREGVGHVWHMEDDGAADTALAALGGWLAAQLPGTATPDS